jgi:hypothetical protein
MVIVATIMEGIGYITPVIVRAHQEKNFDIALNQTGHLSTPWNF